jgi:hypothetical protein
MINVKPKVRELPKIRRSINGLAYDTETASVLYRYDSDEDSGTEYCGFQYEVGLLQNLWGHYFCYSYDDTQPEEGYRVTPLTKEEAMKWAERYCPLLVEDIFGKLHEAGEGPAYTPKGVE